MSRSADRLTASVLAASVLVGAVLAMGMAAPAAHADEPVAVGAAPVLSIIGPIVEASTTVQAIDGRTQVAESPTTVRARLDSTLLFRKDSARLRPGARAAIRELAATLAERTGGTVTITGYTDDLGSARHGLRLSRQRAAAVASVLKGRLTGSGWSFVVVGRGEADPAVPNSSEANRRKNRRVVVVWTP